MAITHLMRWSGLDREFLAANVKETKAFIEKHGGEVGVGQIYTATGPHADQWLISTAFPDRETYRKAEEALVNDPAYQKLMAAAMERGKVEEGALIAGIDL